jgi:cell division protein FtsW (lipid II flippase)
MIDVQWSFWAVLPAVCMGVVLVASTVQLWRDRTRRTRSDELPGGLWFVAGLLFLFVAYLPVFTLSASRWISFPGLALFFVGWLRHRRSRAAHGAPGQDT